MSGQGSFELVLTAGRSKTTREAFNAQVAAMRKMVGASADWAIAAPGLDAQHAEIAWDGATLWLRDNGSRAGTWVGSQKLTQEWRALRVGEQVRLGQAVLTMQAVGADDDGMEEFDDQATMVAGSSKKAPTSDSGDGESTMIVNAVGDAPSAPAGAAHPTGAASAGGPVRHGTLPPRVNTIAPRVNVTRPPGVQPAPTSNVATIVGEDNALAAYARSLQDASAGGVGQPFGTPQPMGASPTGQPVAGLGGFSGPIADFGPPPDGSIFGSIPPPEVALPPPTGQRKLFDVLPPRTAIMLGVAIVGSLVVAFMPMPAEPRRAAQRPVPPELLAPAPAWQQPVPGRAAGDGLVAHLNSSVAPPPPPTPAPGQRPARTPPPPAQTTFLERQAADLVLQNRVRDALPLYAQLQGLHPEQAVYRDMVILLRRKVEALACPPGSPTPCPAVAPAPVQAVPTPAVPAQAVSGQAAPTPAVPVQAVPVQAVPVQAVPVQAVPVQGANPAGGVR